MYKICRKLRADKKPEALRYYLQSLRLFCVELFFCKGNMRADSEYRQGWAFEDDLTGHGAFGVENQSAVAFLFEIGVDIVTDFFYGVLDAAHEQFVTLFDILG